jgi:hypothetical protein
MPDGGRARAFSYSGSITPKTQEPSLRSSWVGAAAWSLGRGVDHQRVPSHRSDTAGPGLVIPTAVYAVIDVRETPCNSTPA